MPCDDFKCDDCGIVAEYETTARPVCPDCGVLMRRVWTAKGAIFKGSGFFVNDYPKGGKK